MNGRILSVVAGVYTVYLEDGNTINITPRGNFRFKKMKPCVGDYVVVKNDMIDEIAERKNKLVRPSISNIDYVVIVVSMKEPNYSSYLLDKFLTMLAINNVNPIIVLSKIDLLNDRSLIEKISKEYQKLNIPLFSISKVTGEGVEEFKQYIQNKTVAFAGQTGAGKSSLINLICPTFKRKEGEYSRALNRGKHQTKEVILLPYDNYYLVDTPGFSSLELDLYREDLRKYFPFFTLVKENCFFLDCMHINEPKCRIRDLVENEVISEEHYNNYRQLFDELIYRKDRFK